MTEALGRPRVEGTFAAEDLRAFDVNWGSGEAGLVIQNSYADVTGGRMQKDGGEIVVNGRFSLGFPRRDKGEEINGRVRVTTWTAADFKHAFEIEDYDVEGMLSGEYHLYGPYQGPFGFGTLTIDKGVAYGEPFDTASGSLRFEGNGVRIDGIQLQKGGGTAEGAAFIGWNGTYSFNTTGRRIPMESVKATAYPQMPLTGLLEFNADGNGTFDVPRYQFRGRIRDLFVLDEGVGEVTGRLDVRGDVMALEVEAASPRLAVSGTGRVELSEARNVDLSLRFTDTSLDPYARAFEPRLSPFTTAVGSGTLRVDGRACQSRAARRGCDVRAACSSARSTTAAQRRPDPHSDEQQHRPRRRHALHRRRHGARRLRHARHERPPHRRPGAWEREPRHSPGVLSQHPQFGQRRVDRAGERCARRAGHPGPGESHERPAALLLPAAFARGGERQHPVRLAQHQAGRADRPGGGRAGELRRTHRPRRLYARGPGADRDRPETCGSAIPKACDRTSTRTSR